MTTDVLERARDSCQRRSWAEAYRALTDADGRGLLDLEDLERLALAAHLTGRDDDGDAALERATQEWQRRGDAGRAARCASWLAFSLLRRGEHDRVGGWLARAGRLLEESGRSECGEAALLLVPAGLQRLSSGDAEGALELVTRADELARRCGEPDAAVLALLGRGQAHVALGEVSAGTALLDEVMVAATADDVSPVVVGVAYCGAILACRATFDVSRAQAWTAALARWCDDQPGLVPFRGQCLVHRAEVLHLQGSWPTALVEVERARARLAEPPGQPALGLAAYEHGELLRVTRRHAEATRAYEEASRCGHVPQPGLALLRLAQGQVDAADTAIRDALEGATDRPSRWRLLAADVEIALAVGDDLRARASADELADAAEAVGTPCLEGVAAQAAGRVLLADGQVSAAVTTLRRAWACWQRLDAPYEAARTRLLVGLACRTLGDEDTALRELDAARSAFERLGARHDLSLVRALLPDRSPDGSRRAPDGLTPREVDVLRLVTRGLTDREIAAALVLSEHTVRRHLRDASAKTGVATRTAVTTYTLGHDLA